MTWVQEVTAARDAGGTFFDFLTAVDLQDDGFEVVCRLWDPVAHVEQLLTTRCPRQAPTVPTLTAVFAGAAWHERSVAEMFAIGFDGHPALTPLLLPDGYAEHPLRKEFVLQARVDKPWPGAKEPGESDDDVAGRPPRRKNRPLGVPPT